MKFTTNLPEELVVRLRSTVLGLQRAGAPARIASATQVALEQWCTATEAAYNDGQPFPLVQGSLPAGRPLETSYSPGIPAPGSSGGTWPDGKEESDADPSAGDAKALR